MRTPAGITVGMHEQTRDRPRHGARQFYFFYTKNLISFFGLTWGAKGPRGNRNKPHVYNLLNTR